MTKVNKKVLFLLASIAIICAVIALFLFGRNDLLNQNTATGLVTSKLTDCVGGEELDRNGNLAPIKEVSCDGGSTITIDYKDTFVTTTGLVASGGYSVDVSSIKAGDRVKVRYVTDSEGHKSLNCKGCGVTKD